MPLPERVLVPAAGPGAAGDLDVPRRRALDGLLADDLASGFVHLGVT